MKGAHRNGERLDIPDMRDRQPVRLHVLDMLGPEIDKGHVFAGLDHMRAGIAADRSGAHHRNLLTSRHQPSSTLLRRMRHRGLRDPSTSRVGWGSDARHRYPPNRAWLYRAAERSAPAIGRRAHAVLRRWCGWRWRLNQRAGAAA